MCANCGLEINLSSFKQHIHPENSLLHVDWSPQDFQETIYICLNRTSCAYKSRMNRYSVSVIAQKTGLNTKLSIHCQNALTLAPECTHMVYPLKCAATTYCQLRKDRRSNMPTACWIIKRFNLLSKLAWDVHCSPAHPLNLVIELLPETYTH